ncbi:hypothetical protein GEMRC1_004896 [Eukaryota sp. GEM-RC1]
MNKRGQTVEFLVFLALLQKSLSTLIPLNLNISLLLIQSSTNLHLNKMSFYSVGKFVVDDFFSGFNGSILAYGQTSAGKTYSMLGACPTNHQIDPGITPRTLQYIFDLIQSNKDPNSSFSLSASYVEIYLERVRDLLDPSRQNLSVVDDPVEGISIQGCTHPYFAAKGSENRVSAAHAINIESSRSHAIFILNLRRTSSSGSFLSRLFLVDLAGSEKLTKTNAQGCRLDEAKRINTSLLALGQVVSALTSHDRSKSHVPYRDSKLTRVLQESLGGNAKTALIVVCSPSSCNISETLSTLKFGTRAKSIKNEARLNVVSGEGNAGLTAQLVSAQDEIIKLKKELSLVRSGNDANVSKILNSLFGIGSDWIEGREKELAESIYGSCLFTQVSNKEQGEKVFVEALSFDNIVVVRRMVTLFGDILIFKPHFKKWTLDCARLDVDNWFSCVFKNYSKLCSSFDVKGILFEAISIAVNHQSIKVISTFLNDVNQVSNGKVFDSGFFDDLLSSIVNQSRVIADDIFELLVRRSSGNVNNELGIYVILFRI